MKNIIYLYLYLFAAISFAQPSAWVRSFGARTCGEALSDITNNSNNKTAYNSFLDGYITFYNWNQSKNVSQSLSPATIEQLWIAKCSKSENITKVFVLIVDEIFEETKQKRQ